MIFASFLDNPDILVASNLSFAIILFLQVLLNLLYFYGMRGLLKECLLHRYFSKVLPFQLDLWLTFLFGKFNNPRILIRILGVACMGQNQT